MNNKHDWDFFIAHAGDDLPDALRLHDLLGSKSRAFVDQRCLLYGDDRDRELAAAQRRSLITLVLASAKADEAYYARTEIAAAIRLAMGPSLSSCSSKARVNVWIRFRLAL